MPVFSDRQPSTSGDREYVQTRFNWISLISSSSSSSPTPVRFSKRSSIARLLCEPVGRADPSWYGCRPALSNRMLNAFFRSRSNFSRSVSWRSSRKLFFPFVEASGVGSAAWMFGSVNALFLSEIDSDSWISSPAPRGSASCWWRIATATGRSSHPSGTCPDTPRSTLSLSGDRGRAALPATRRRRERSARPRSLSCS